MTENKTQPTHISVSTYLAQIRDSVRRQECEQLMLLMTELSRADAIMWGEAIVGFGQYHYQYASGRKGDYFRCGFSSRQNGISIYLMACGANQHQLLPSLGKFKMGKSCLTVRHLSDIDIEVLSALLADSLAEMAARYPE